MTMTIGRITAKAGAVVLILLVLAGCGDDGEDSDGASFNGVYKVASHTRSLNACDTEGTPFNGDAFFKLSHTNGKLNYQVCDSAESCLSVDPNLGFARQVDSQWVGVRSDALESRGACDAHFTERIASRIDGENIQIEVRQYSGEFERGDGQECDDQLVESNRGELECHQRDIVKAAPVERP